MEAGKLLFGHLKALIKASKKFNEQGVSIRRRLVLYWVSMVLALFLIFILVLNLIGTFSKTERELSAFLELQERNTSAALSNHLSELTAQGIVLSKEISKKMSNLLNDRGVDFDELNDNISLIAELEGDLYDSVYTTLNAGDCNGAFVLLDATANTGLDGSEKSRIGCYLRYSDVSTAGSSNQRLTYFRGMFDIARKNGVQLHNRWNPEFDTSFLPGYDDFMAIQVDRIADSFCWSGRMHITGTWEDANLLYVPVVYQGRVCGICGIELGDLYFQLSYASVKSQYGNVMTLIAPLEGDHLLLDKAMFGGSAGAALQTQGVLSIKDEKYFESYDSGSVRYIGAHKSLEHKTVDGKELVVALLLPESSFSSAVSSERAKWMIISFAALLLLLVLSFFLSRSFAKPITQGIRSLKEEPLMGGTVAKVGIKEIDELHDFVRALKEKRRLAEEMPPGVQLLFTDFSSRVQTLTPMERTVLQYYIEGHDTVETANLAFISINTVKKHNTNIYRKLGITTREELMLYIDLFRRCGTIEEISYI